MNRLPIRLNDRKRIAPAAALAALLAFLSGGANALAATNTVWCVPDSSINPACTSGAARLHIQAAVNAAKAGDVIMVGPGTYFESVNIAGKLDLTILGAQAGQDARTRGGGTLESIVDGNTTGNPPFTLCGDTDVAIDGFTLQGNTTASASCSPFLVAPAGIWDHSSGTRVLNNIIQNNSSGVYSFISTGLVMEHNLFKDNNAGSGSYVGYGIYSFVGFITADENAFCGNQAAALFLMGATAPMITNNTSESDGAFVVLYATAYGVIAHNQGKNFGARGVLPVYFYWPGPIVVSHKADAAVDIGPSNTHVTIAANDLECGVSPISSGIAFTTVLGLGLNPVSVSPSYYATVKDNQIKGFPLNGIVEEATGGVSSTGMANYAVISGNRIEDNGHDGILIEYADTGVTNAFNQLFSNVAQNNQVSDCEDDTATYGTLTLETYNTWVSNVGPKSSPAGLCPASPWQ